jgi:hypothetical protein
MTEDEVKAVANGFGLVREVVDRKDAAAQARIEALEKRIEALESHIINAGTSDLTRRRMLARKPWNDAA